MKKRKVAASILTAWGCTAGLFLWASLSVPLAVGAEPKYIGPKTIWSCRKPKTDKNILWLVEWGPRSYIKALDERIRTRYTMNGLEKRWDWGLDETDLTYSYTITLTPDMKATYFDFKLSKNGTAQPKDVYECSKG